MKFTANTKQLKAACDAARRAVSSKTTIPALEGLLLRSNGSDLEVTGYDLECAIQVRAEVDTQEAGAVIIDAALLCGILAKLGGETVTVEVDKKAMIGGGGSEYKLNIMPEKDFPEIPTATDGQGHIAMPLDALQHMVRGTVYAASVHPDTKPIHTGVLFERVDGDKLTLAAIDGFRCAVRKTEDWHCTHEFEAQKFVVPAKAVKEIASLKSSVDQVQIYLHKRHVSFIVGNMQITSRLLDGEFMNYQAAIPKKHEAELVINVADMIAAVERVALMAAEKIMNPIHMRLLPDDSAVELSCASGIGTACERVSAKGNGEWSIRYEIGFNHRYMLDALNACDDAFVHMRVLSTVQPMVIVPTEGDDYLQLVLPVRLDSGDMR